MVNFEAEVLEASFQKPVVVDFWAEWCGPCRFLGPVIEELAGEAQGKWKLVKINTEQQPGVAARFQIRGIPNLKIFYKGKIVAELSGALPKPQLHDWLQQNLPDERRQELAQLLENIDNGKSEITELENFIQQNPDLEEAKEEFIKRVWQLDIEKAMDIAKSLSFKYEELKKDVETIHLFSNLNFQEADSIKAYLEQAQSALQQKNFDKTLDLLITSIMINKKCCEEIARKTVIALFHLLGETHEFTQKYRRKFGMALY
jgi:putative thioredoxin